MSDRSLSIDIILTFARQFLAGLLILGTVLLIARALHAEGTGIYSVALLLPTLLSQLLNLGLVSANVYFIASRQFDLQLAWSASRDLGLVMAGAGSISGALLIIAFGQTAFPGASTTILLLALAIFPITLFSSMIVGIFQAQQSFRIFNILVLTEPVVTLCLTVIYWTIYEPSLISVMLATLAGYSTALVVGLVLLAKDVTIFAPATFRMSYLRPALRYGIVAHISNLVTFLNYRMAIYLVNLFLGPSVTGIYTMAVRLAEQIWIISQAVSTVLFPRLSALSDQAETRALMTITIARATLWASLLGGLALLFLAGPFFRHFFGAEFTDAAPVLAVLLPGIVALACSRVLANDLAAQGKVLLNCYLSFLVFGTNLVAALVLLPLYGVYGAAIATSMSYSADLLMRLFLFSRLYSGKWWHVLVPTARDARMVAQLFLRR